MDSDLRERLRTGALDLQVSLDGAQLDSFDRYLALLLQWNERINLTAVRDARGIVERHFLDSIAIVSALEGAKTLVDIGSGAGFPGAVAALCLPKLEVTCVDSIQKKIAFLQTLKRELLSNLQPIAARDSELAAQGRTFDAAVSRATWDPQEWLEHGAVLVNAGGVVIAMQAGETALTPPPTLTHRRTLRLLNDGRVHQVVSFVHQ